MAVRLALKSPENVKDAHAIHGSCLEVYVDGMDISRYVTSVELHASAEGVVLATVTMCLADIDIDGSINVDFVREHVIPGAPHGRMGGNAQYVHRSR
jgi:hypothetical protein